MLQREELKQNYVKPSFKLFILTPEKMPKYRIVARNHWPTGDKDLFNKKVFYAQRKVLNLFWLDCLSLELGPIAYVTYHTDVNVVRNYVEQKLNRPQDEVIEEF